MELFIRNINLLLFPLISIVVVIIAVLTYMRRGRLKVGNLINLELGGAIELEEEKIRKRLSQEIPDVSPAEKQYLLLREYHAQGLAQSKISFWFSLIFASLGFAIIIIAILSMDRNVQLTQQGRTFITLIAGTIIDAVSALFFVQSNKARQLMTEFFDRLRVDRKLDESLKLTTQIPDPILESRLKMLLALNLADVKPAEDILLSILNLEYQPVKPNE